MRLSRLNKRISDWLVARFGPGAPVRPPPSRGPTTHVIILDGTMSSLEDGEETNAGLTMKLLRGCPVSVYYEPGLQWSHWRRCGDVFFGRGLNRQIRRAYGYLASRYRPGDRIFLFGYSRGAYAVRSLAGVIDRVGLLHAAHATERNIRQAYRHYECTPDGAAAQAFAARHCHAAVPIEMIGAWDSVKSLGINAPLLWRLSAPRHAFHNHQLGPSVKRGYHALARHETRVVYSPVMWDSDAAWPGQDLVQMWFRGSHGDVGGNLGGFHAARPLANIPLVWMLERAEAAGLPLPDGWSARFPRDASAPSVGTWRGWSAMFPTRKPRRVGLDASERIHPSVAAQEPAAAWFWPFFGAKPEA
ncbi:MAG: DUF2235 domain-containing protein [Pseudomonadota bacterium]